MLQCYFSMHMEKKSHIVAMFCRRIHPPKILWRTAAGRTVEDGSWKDCGGRQPGVLCTYVFNSFRLGEEVNDLLLCQFASNS